MIKVDLYKLNTKNYFTGVKLDLFPTEIYVYFKDKKFVFQYSEIVYYKCEYNKAGEETIIFQLENNPTNLNIVIKPYKKEEYNIIIRHFEMYCNTSIAFTVNPIFKK